MQPVDTKLWASSTDQGFRGGVRWLLGELAWGRIPHKVLMGEPESKQVTVEASLCSTAANEPLPLLCWKRLQGGP